MQISSEDMEWEENETEAGDDNCTLAAISGMQNLSLNGRAAGLTSASRIPTRSIIPVIPVVWVRSRSAALSQNPSAITSSQSGYGAVIFQAPVEREGEQLGRKNGSSPEVKTTKRKQVVRRKTRHGSLPHLKGRAAGTARGASLPPGIGAGFESSESEEEESQTSAKKFRFCFDNQALSQ